jgi:hypothetical protein
MTKQVLRSLAYEAFKEYCLWDGIDGKIAFSYYVLFTHYANAFIS